MLIESGWKLTLITPESAVEEFAMALDPFCYGLSAFEIEEGGNWRVEGFVGDMPPQDNLTAAVALAALRAGVPEPRLDCVPIPATDWVAETQNRFNHCAPAGISFSLRITMAQFLLDQSH